MAKLDDFNKITWGGNEISKVYHLNQEIWRVSSAPGPSTLIAGDMEAGFYGEVPASEFVTGDELCSLAGITAGTSQYSNEPWLKFSYLNETVFVAKKPIRHTISWNQINAAGCVFGEKIVTIKSQRYKVTLLKSKTEGKQNDTSAHYGTIIHNSMWNRLLGQVHKNAPSNFGYSNNMENTLVNWGINYTDADLLTHFNYGNGSYSWCQEYGDSTGYRMMRGYVGISNSSPAVPGHADNSFGFRPALILEDANAKIQKALNEARMNLKIKTGNGNEWTVGSSITGVRQNLQPLPATFIASNGEVINVTYISTNPAALTNKGGRVGPGNTILRAYFKHPEQPDLLPTITPSYAEFYVTVV